MILVLCTCLWYYRWVLSLYLSMPDMVKLVGKWVSHDCNLYIYTCLNLLLYVNIKLSPGLLLQFRHKFYLLLLLKYWIKHLFCELPQGDVHFTIKSQMTTLDWWSLINSTMLTCSQQTDLQNKVLEQSKSLLPIQITCILIINKILLYS